MSLTMTKLLSIPAAGILGSLAFSLEDVPSATGGVVINSVVGAAVVAVVVIFLRFIQAERKDAREERAEQNKVFQDSLEKLIERDERAHAEFHAHFEAIATHQTETNRVLGRIAEKLSA
jgi:uncharacterized membrane protein